MPLALNVERIDMAMDASPAPCRPYSYGPGAMVFPARIAAITSAKIISSKCFSVFIVYIFDTPSLLFPYFQIMPLHYKEIIFLK